MASPASDAFLRAFASSAPRPATLLQLDVSDPTPASFRFATDSVSTPDGQTWEFFIAESGGIHAPGEFLTTGPDLCSADFTLLRRPLSGGTNLMDLFFNYRVVGAAVTVYLWELSLTDFADALCVYRGVVQSYDMTAHTVSLHTLQRRDWNRPVVDRYVTRADYPHAPEASIGAPIPVLYGALRDIEFRSPWPEHPNANFIANGVANASKDVALPQLIGGRRTAAAILVDTGRGSGTNNPKAKVLIAAHKCKRVADFSGGAGMFIEAGDGLAGLTPANASPVGATFVAWRDNRSGTYQTYVQKFDGEGLPLWTSNGVLVSGSTGNSGSLNSQAVASVIADGLGGCWVTWPEYRGVSLDIYFNAVSSSGTPAFGSGTGLPASSATADQLFVSVVKSTAADEVGLDFEPVFIMVWQDMRNGDPGVFANRFFSYGVKDGVTGWGPNGTALRNGTSGSYGNNPCSCPDGTGGVIAAWEDVRPAAPATIYAQRLNNDGTPQWTAEGLMVPTTGTFTNSLRPNMISDGAGGAYIIWDDQTVPPSGLSNHRDVRMVRINGLGAQLSGWTAAYGLQISIGGGLSTTGHLAMASDGDVLVCWRDETGTGTNTFKIGVQKMSPTGGARFTAGGIKTFSSAGGGFASVVETAVAAGLNGDMLVAWSESGPVGVYAQCFDSAGNKKWGANGVSMAVTDTNLFTGSDVQHRGVNIASDGRGGAIVSWSGDRASPGSGNYDVFMQHVDFRGNADWTSGGVAAGYGTGNQALTSLAFGDGDVINTVREAGMLLADDTAIAYAPAFPNDLVTNTSAENPRAVLDPRNDLSYAKLDYSAGQRLLRLKFLGLSDVGDMRSVDLVLGYKSVSNTGLKARITDLSSSNPTPYVDFNVGPQSSVTATYRVINQQWGVLPLPASAWDTGQMQLEIGWFGGGGDAGTAEIYFAAYVVRYKPRQSIIQTEKTISTTHIRPVIKTWPLTINWTNPYTTTETVPAVTEFVSNVYGNADGWFDDASGTYTDVPQALMQRATDVARHLISHYGGEDIGNIENGVGVFGSFTDARAALKTWCGLDMLHAISISETSDVGTVLSWLGSNALFMTYLSRFDDRWKLIPWLVDPPVNYVRIVAPGDVFGPDGLECSTASDANIVNSIKVMYGYDAWKKAYLHESSVSASQSTSGHLYRNLRDEYLTVVAGINDKIDIVVGTGGPLRTGTIAPGAYDTVQSFCEAATAALVSTLPGAAYLVSYGGQLKDGYNNYLDFNDGTTRFAIMTEGVYTMEQLATEAQRAMNAVSSNWVVNYSRATRKFTISRSSGSYQVYGLSGGHRTYSGWPTLGVSIAVNPAANVPNTSDCEVEEQRIIVAMNNPNTDLLFETGVNGLNGTQTSAHDLLGFDWLRDALTGGAGIACSHGPKGLREAKLALMASRYGTKKEKVIDGRAIYDTPTARELRNRLVDLAAEPRLTVRFKTYRMPDIERGRVIQFSADFDAFQPFPKPESDGSWANKKFWVVEVNQMLGPTWETEVIAVEAAPSPSIGWGLGYGFGWGG